MAIKSKYKLVLFDGDDTLYRVRGSVGLIYSEELSNFGLKISAHEIDRIVPKVWKEFEAIYLNHAGDSVTSQAEEEQRWYQFVQMVLRTLKVDLDSRAYFKAVYERFSRGASRELLPGATEILNWVRSQGFSTGLLTNNDRRIKQVVNELGLEPLLNHVLVSAELGFKKPSKNCFEEVSNRTKISAKEIVYVGDSLELDYFAAKAAEWDAVWFNWKNKPKPEGVIAIKTLSELQALL